MQSLKQQAKEFDNLKKKNAEVILFLENLKKQKGEEDEKKGNSSYSSKI